MLESETIIPKTEMKTEESDTGSYTSSRSMDDEELENNYNELDYKHYLSEEEYDIEDHPFCFCGRVAKRRMSRTDKNPGRWFYNCAKKINTQCRYFQWVDELYEGGHDDMVETDEEEYEYETHDEEEVINYLEHEDEETVSCEQKSVLSYQVSTASVKSDQLKEMDLFPQYADLDLLVQEHKPHVGLDGSILSLAPPGSPPV